MKNINNESLARYLATIFYSHKAVVTFVFFIVFISFLAYAVFAPDMYLADGTFLVKAKNTNGTLSVLKENEQKAPLIKRSDLNSEAQILNSGHIISVTAQKLIDEKLVNIDNNDQGISHVESLVNKISENYSVNIDSKSKLLELSIIWADPKQATVILNKLMDTYLEYRLEIFNSAQTKDISETQVTGYVDNWKRKKQQILDLIKKHKVPDLNLELANNLELKKEYQIQLAITEKEKISLKEDIKILSSMLNDKEMHLFSFLSSGVLSSLVDSLQDTQKEKLEVDKLFLPNRVEVKNLDMQLKKNYGKIKSEVESHLRKQKSVLNAKEENIADMNYSVKKLDRRNIELKEISINMDQLKMESSFLASSIEKFYNKNNISQTGGILDANIILLSRAKPQMALDKLARIKILILGLILAFALSFIVALILDTMGNRIRTQRDLQKQIKFPILFSIEEAHGRKL